MYFRIVNQKILVGYYSRRGRTAHIRRPRRLSHSLLMEDQSRPAPQVRLLRLSQQKPSKCPLASWRLTTGMIEELLGGWKPVCPRPTYVVVPKRTQSRAQSKGSSSSSLHGASLQRSVDRLCVAPRRLALGHSSGELSGFLDSDFNYHSYHETAKPVRQSIDTSSVTWSGHVHVHQEHREDCDELSVPACLQWRASIGDIGRLLPSDPCEHCSSGRGMQVKDKSMDVLDLLALPTKKRLKKYRNSQLKRHGPLNSRMSLPDLSAPLAGWRSSSGELRNLNAYNLARAYPGTTHGPTQPSHFCQKGPGEGPLYPPSFTMPNLQQKRGPFGTITIIPSNPSIPSQVMRGGRYFNLEVQGIQPNKQFSGTEYLMYRRT